MEGCEGFGPIAPSERPQDMSREELLAEVQEKDNENERLRRQKERAEYLARRAKRWSFP